MISPNSIFKSAKPVIAMIHLGALPGTPANGLTMRKSRRRRCVRRKFIVMQAFMV
ncbi:MAG: hypothetical protein WDN00_07255 [Limisphaerales bacterium]